MAALTKTKIALTSLVILTNFRLKDQQSFIKVQHLAAIPLDIPNQLQMEINLLVLLTIMLTTQLAVMVKKIFASKRSNIARNF